MQELSNKEPQNFRGTFSVGEFVKARGTSEVILWMMDEEFFPTISVGKVDREDVLLVLETRELKEKNVTRHWIRAVHVLASTGQTGWVGQGWLQRV
jgi:hypothetical protein